MDGNGGFPSSAAPQRSGGPHSPITIPLSVVTLTAPRPDIERRDNDYVETPFRGATQSPPPPPISPPRPPAPSPPQQTVSKQPESFSKASVAGAATAACGTARPSIMCTQCGRCKCATCRSPKPLPQCWSCNGSCLLSADSIVDYTSCLCCVKGLFYHCSDEADDVDGSCADDPCGCGPDRRTARWGCLAALACVLPCLVLYWPLRGAKRAVELCYERHSRSGCRCRSPKQPPQTQQPAKRLLGNQDF